MVTNFKHIILKIISFLFITTLLIGCGGGGGGLGLSGGQAFAFAIGYVVPPTIIALILSFVFNKFKLSNKSFNKFWFWIMVITLISYAANSLVS